MHPSVWKILSRVTAGAVAALLLAAGSARASDPEVEALKAQIEKLTKDYGELQKQLQTAAQQTPPSESGPTAAQINKDDVKKMIDDALKDKGGDKGGETKDGKSDKGKWYEVGSDLNMYPHWKDGSFWIESKHKDFGVWIGGWLEQDWAWAGQPGAIQGDSSVGTLRDSSFPRRFRLDFGGYAWENMEWLLEVDLENNPANNLTSNGGTATANTTTGAVSNTGNLPSVFFTDFWVGYKDLPFLGTVRVGHVRDPFGLEMYSSSRTNEFMERGSGFDCIAGGQEFMPGVWGFKSWFNERLNFAWSACEQDPSQDDINFGSGDYAFTASIRSLPMWANNGRCFFFLAADYQYRSGYFDPAIADHDARFRDRPQVRSEGLLTPRLIDTGNIVSDRQDLFCLEALLNLGSFSVQSEYTATMVNNAAVGGKDVGDRTFTAFYVFASYYLTGETRGWDKRLLRQGKVKVLEPFFWVRDEDGHHHRGLGAWEVLARYDTCNLDSGPVRGGVLDQYTLGLNWYLNDSLKVMFNYVLADRHVDAPKASGTESFVGVRVHLDY
jgi:phosphate-selective porin OprO/OprP